MEVLQLGPLNLEFLLASVWRSHYHINVAVFYRPPSSSVTSLSDIYTLLETLLPSSFRNFMLAGDFNVDFNDSTHLLYSHLSTIFSSFGLSQVVPCSTCTFTCGRSTLLDLALVSDPLLSPAVLSLLLGILIILVPI